MSSLTREQRDALRLAAAAATPGPWYEQPSLTPEECGIPNGQTPRIVSEVYEPSGEIEEYIVADYVERQGDLSFIALANPQTIIALLDAADERDTLQQERDEARAAVEKLVELSRYLCTTVGKCEGCPRHETPSKCGMCSIPGLRKWAYAPAPVPDAQGAPSTGCDTCRGLGTVIRTCPDCTRVAISETSGAVSTGDAAKPAQGDAPGGGEGE